MAVNGCGTTKKRLSEIRPVAARIVVRVGAPLSEVSLFEIRDSNADSIIDIAIKHACDDGNVGQARADYIDLFIFDDGGHLMQKTRLSSSDGAKDWQSRDLLIMTAQMGRQLSRSERNEFYDTLPKNFEEGILIVQ